MGRILEREGDKWEVIKLPMLAVEGDPLGRGVGDRLWPEWFTDGMVESAKLDARSWHALYQQEPTGDEGDYFKREWIQTYDELPKVMKLYGASDFAVTEGGGDWTEHGVFGVDPGGNVFVVDWWRGRTAPNIWIESLLDLIQKHGPMVWFGESGPIRRSVEPFLLKRQSERNAWCRIEWMASISEKDVRARGIQALMSMGKVWFPRYASWREAVEGQLLRFPAGRNDDAVDVMSLIGRGLEHISTPLRRKLKPIQYSTAGVV
jgi:predicted phage terminase large subunit-like protein